VDGTEHESTINSSADDFGISFENETKGEYSVQPGRGEAMMNFTISSFHR